MEEKIISAGSKDKLKKTETDMKTASRVRQIRC